MNIQSKNKSPSNALSNFAPHPFVIDEINCSSMEGFLQSLKFKSPEMQKEVYKLVGYAAKKKGYNKNWYQNQILFWKGKEIKRESEEYQTLLDRAYTSLYKNTKFRKALEATHDAKITHTIGRSNIRETVLTKNEFCSRLTELRDFQTLKKVKSKKLM